MITVPFMMGGREPYGWLALTALVTLLASLWCLRQVVTDEPTPVAFSIIYVLVAVAIGLVVLQLTPLTTSLMDLLSPNLHKLLPPEAVVGPRGEAGGTWNLLSVSPHETRIGLILLTAFVVFFGISSHHIRTSDDISRAMELVATTTALMGVFAILQYGTSGGLYFWFYENPYVPSDNVVKGAYTNRNHFAHFMAIGLGPALAWLVREIAASRGEDGGLRPLDLARRLFLAGSVAIIAFSSFSSLSRMGSFSTALAGVSFMLVAWRFRLISSRIVLASLLVVGGLAIGLTLIQPKERGLDQKFEEIVTTEITEVDGDDGRLKLWTALAEVIRDFPLVGTGVGSHREIYQCYLGMKDGEAEYTHAENGYLNVAVETGLVGLALVLAVQILVGWWLLRAARGSSDPAHTTAIAGCFAALVATSVHSLTDFAWYAPGNIVVLLVLAAVAWRLSLIASKEQGAWTWSVMFPRPLFLGSLAASLAMGVWTTTELWPTVAAYGPYRTYLITHFSRPANLSVEEAENLELRSLLAAAKANPQDGHVLLLAAAELQRTFDVAALADPELGLPVSQLRDVVISSGFSSREEVRTWLKRATGSSLKYLDGAQRFARRAVSCLPLSGLGYYQLAELGFVEGESSKVSDDWMDLAIHVRPHNPTLQIAAGRRALLKGETALALEQWKEAFPRSRSARNQIITMLAPSMPALAMQMEFKPDTEALQMMAKVYGDLGKEEDMLVAQQACARTALIEAREDVAETAVNRYLIAADMLYKSGQYEELNKCLHEIEDRSFNSYALHRAVGLYFTKLENWARAATHFQWCVEQHPDDAFARKMADEATKMRLRAVAPASPILPSNLSSRILPTHYTGRAAVEVQHAAAPGPSRP